jgi:putative restriction endonuclease
VTVRGVRPGELCQALLVGSGSGEIAKSLLDRFAALRQHQRNGQRSPHKPLLVLLALGRLAGTGSSMLPWSVAEPALADLIAEFGPPSRTGRAQSAAYPFTRLRADGGLWVLDQDVPMDLVGPLAGGHVAGRFEWSVEDELRADPALAGSIVRMLALSNFPETVASDVLEAVGLDPRSVLGSPEAASWESGGGRAAPGPGLAVRSAAGLGPAVRILRV